MSLLTIRSGATEMPEESFSQFFTDVTARGGVIDIVGGHLEVTEKSGTADMSVDVAIGRAIIKKGDASNAYPSRNTTSKNVSINSNASGNPRISSIVMYVDLSATPSTDGSGVVEISSVDGTPAASPSAPSNSDIESAIGASNPYEVLADISVASGASSIVNANITDKRRRPYFRNSNQVNPIDFSSSISIPMKKSNQHRVTLTGNITVSSFDDMQVGEWATVSFVQDGTGGHTITITPTTNALSPDTSPATGANETTNYAFQKRSDGSFDFYLLGKDY